MQHGSITHLHLARVKETPSDPVSEATAISGKGLEGDRSCSERNIRQVLFMDQETLAGLDLKPGQIKENITTTGLDLSNVEAGQVFFIGDRRFGKPGDNGDSWPVRAMPKDGTPSVPDCAKSWTDNVECWP